MLRNLSFVCGIEYWLDMRIACYYDSINYVYVIFTLPYIIDLRFVITHDIMGVQFNQTRDHVDCLMLMLFDRTPGVIVIIGDDEFLSEPFLGMLKHGSEKGEK